MCPLSPTNRIRGADPAGLGSARDSPLGLPSKSTFLFICADIFGGWAEDVDSELAYPCKCGTPFWGYLVPQGCVSLW